MEPIFHHIRTACREVAATAQFVQIDTARIPAYAARLPLDRIFQPEHDPRYHYLGHGEATVAFFLTLDSINFGSGYFPYLRKPAGLSGYFTVAAALNQHFQAHGPLAATDLAQLTADDCARLFGQQGNPGPAYELMALFAQALNDLGQYIADRFAGSFAALVAAAGGSAGRLVELLAVMPFFRDVAHYNQRAVPLYKRAQISAADLAIAFAGQGPGRFDDLDQLTIFADNLVPHVLRVDGLLHYAPDLAARIDAEALLEAGSAEEVELRACALHAVELLVAELRQAGQQVNAMQLDNLLWSRGQGYKRVAPRHRARSVYY